MAEAAAGETAQKERASDGERWSGRRRRARAAIAMAAAWAVFGWEIWGEVDGTWEGLGRGGDRAGEGPGTLLYSFDWFGTLQISRPLKLHLISVPETVPRFILDRLLLASPPAPSSLLALLPCSPLQLPC